jgi:hypothetical protein
MVMRNLFSFYDIVLQTNRVEFLDAFFSTEKGQQVVAWLHAAALGIAPDNAIFSSTLAHGAVGEWSLPLHFQTLLSQAHSQNITSIPVIAVVCKTLHMMVWSVAVLSVFSSCTTRPTVEVVEGLIMKTKAVIGHDPKNEVASILLSIKQKWDAYSNTFHHLVNPKQ